MSKFLAGLVFGALSYRLMHDFLTTDWEAVKIGMQLLEDLEKRQQWRRDYLESLTRNR